MDEITEVLDGIGNSMLEDAVATVLTLVDGLVGAGLQISAAAVTGKAALDPDGLEDRQIYVLLEGPDTPLLMARNAEVLHAIEHLAVEMLRLPSESHDFLSLDALPEGGELTYKEARAMELRRVAGDAIARVNASGRPYRFQPMNSRERRLLHLTLKPAAERHGMVTESAGDPPRRFVVLYPSAMAPQASGGRS